MALRCHCGYGTALYISSTYSVSHIQELTKNASKTREENQGGGSIENCISGCYKALNEEELEVHIPGTADFQKKHNMVW